MAIADAETAPAGGLSEVGEMRKLIQRTVMSMFWAMAITWSSQSAAGLAYQVTVLDDPGLASELLRITESGLPFVDYALATAIGVNFAQDRNEQGTVVGTCGGPLGASYRACAWSAATGTFIVPFLIPPSTTSTAFASTGYDVNSVGDFLGAATFVNAGNSPGSLQIYTSGGELVQLPVGSYRPASFNRYHTVVGSGPNYGTAFIFDDGEWFSLSDLVSNLGSFVLGTPFDINDAGAIVGVGLSADGLRRGYLLTPLHTVPLPSTLLLAALGALLIGAGGLPKRGDRRRIWLRCRAPRFAAAASPS